MFPVPGPFCQAVAVNPFHGRMGLSTAGHERQSSRPGAAAEEDEMHRRGFTHRRRPARGARPLRKKSLEEKLRRLDSTQDDYRRQSLAIHGSICARCGMEFNSSNLHLLTVHHKDGNPHNNPKDGSNWENLCIYCHDDLHSRGVLADYLTGDEK